ncbi:MAG: shikimate dehydrogenase [Dethiobacteria bacterium]|jgi:shikimate 5-dehydrogenase|nr:shikimate dehydrogenase [Bacillota bacterium]HOP69533.1 shikimate dehydrogenase [Bacillota bacterium]HPT34448.1 shikimate dehydrogenase [Bacillota bacterium]HPZ64837.1 shikimate dehydrogenase [Bacillota bacterium]HQD05432.1 shikimate dehydrogenase [Bacillota bacterium]
MQHREKENASIMYFIGTSTRQSSIMPLFPQWMRALGFENAKIKGIDLELHAKPEAYRKAVALIKNDPSSRGALVTTHKIDLYHAAKDMFDYLDPFAQNLEELSCLATRDGKLLGYAIDPISSGLAMKAFIPEGFWQKHKGEALIMGAGGSALAICTNLLNKDNGDNIPSRVIITNRSRPRLESARKKLQKMYPHAVVEYRHCPEPKHNDAALNLLKPYSLIVNATGLGKDRPGSPITHDGEFPPNSLAWDLNYRGDLLFLHQASRQKEKKSLHIEDGWTYFLHGWTQVISVVFDLQIDGATFDQLAKIAAAEQQKRTW